MTLVVGGAPFDRTGPSVSGSAYVYDLSSGTPTVPVATLNNPSPSGSGLFGVSVSISGTRVVVGSSGGGSVYVYDLSSGMPTVPMATLNNPSPATRDGFGSSVSISGTGVVVGAPSDPFGPRGAGSAYVYDLSSGTPTVPVATLNNPGPATGDALGSSVSISGTRVGVGAQRDDTGATNAGSAYVYDLPGAPTGDAFGSSVSISGTRVVVGAQMDDTGATNAGSAYVYDLSSGTPTVPVATLYNPSPAQFDNFGNSVSISGTRVVVGASSDDTGATDAGSAYVYDLSSGTPTVPVVTLNGPEPAAGDALGNSVSISGTRVVLGSSGAGSAYVYDLSSETPTVPVATLNNPSPGYDSFGASVAIDGTRAVIGAPGDASPQADKGSIYVYGPMPSVGNVSTRLPVGTGDDVLIEGFIVQGPAGSTKKIMVRAIGPSLIPFGIPDAVTNPTLEIRDSSGALIASNDDWANTQIGGIITSDQSSEIAGSGLAPSNNQESAIIANLLPGSFTAIVRGLNNTTGTGVVDAYDLSTASPARLANISTRGVVQPGDGLMIAGFIIQNGNVRAVVRAIGPSLGAFGISNALQDTTLVLYDQNGAILRMNDDWESDQKAELEATGLQPSDPREAALVDTLPPGQYTAHLRGKPESTGIGVVQVYFLQ